MRRNSANSNLITVLIEQENSDQLRNSSCNNSSISHSEVKHHIHFYQKKN